MQSLQQLSILLFVSTFALLNASPEHARLVRHLLRDYDKLEGLPVENENSTLIVTKRLVLIKADVDVAKSTLHLVTVGSMHWRDYRLKWDPDEFGGIDRVRIASEYLWKPDIMLYNTAEAKIREIPGDCVVTNWGEVDFGPITEYTAICNNNSFTSSDGIFKCDLKFASWRYDGNQIGLQNWSWSDENLNVDLSGYHENKDWELKQVQSQLKTERFACCPEPYPHYLYSFTFKSRKANKTSFRWW